MICHHLYFQKRGQTFADLEDECRRKVLRVSLKRLPTDRSTSSASDVSVRTVDVPLMSARSSRSSSSQSSRSSSSCSSSDSSSSSAAGGDDPENEDEASEMEDEDDYHPTSSRYHGKEELNDVIRKAQKICRVAKVS